MAIGKLAGLGLAAVGATVVSVATLAPSGPVIPSTTEPTQQASLLAQASPLVATAAATADVPTVTLVSPANASAGERHFFARATTVNLRWLPVDGAVDFRVLRDGAQIALLEDSQLRYRDMDRTASTAYTYRIEALAEDGRVLSAQIIPGRTGFGANQLTLNEAPFREIQRSRAYTRFNWTPNPLYDTCPKALHDAFWAFGPDNKAYPTWHPPVYEYADGSLCRFGHEHGQDQRTSALFSVTGPMPFGYVNEQVSPSNPAFQRNEDHVGHKVALFNGIREILATAEGEQPVGMACDILFKLHQGTHSADALRNNTHERFLNYRCPNGFELRFKSLQPFGGANSFGEASDLTGTTGAFPAACPDNQAINRGTICQPGGADRRIIPTEKRIADAIRRFGGATDGTGGNPQCDNCGGTAEFNRELAALGVPGPGYVVPIWNNESWQGGPTNLSFPGGVRFRLSGGPYWNLADPSRYYDPNGNPDPASPDYLLGRQINLCYREGSLPYNSVSCRLARSRNGGQPIPFDSPLSPFKGTVRFNEVNFVILENPVPGRTRIYNNVFGYYTLDGDGVNPPDQMPARRSLLHPIRAWTAVSPASPGFEFKLSNFAGTQQCGGSSCWTDFNWYRLRDGRTIDAGIHLPN